jgi:hypothetical protein
MGFMDKAKKLAEQAQQKLDEAQNQFNQGAAPQAPPGDAGGVQYDEHGRPIQAPAPSGPTPDPSAPPAADTPSEVPASPAAPSAPTSEEGKDEPPPAPSGGANTTPDPFKPLQ